ncbi:MAG: penicillin-binding protein [Burkholderiaceae bacterium]|nr:MAG: penicillin-binding protein [Burkholderiaceae bacterium]
MKVDLTRFQPLLAEVRRRLRLMRHPTRRGVALSLAALPVLVLLYVLILIPFTPSIRNIEKARVQQPAIVLSSDNVELAVFKRANQHWTRLADISPHVVDALIATEDHRFYQHHGIDFRRTASAALHTFGGDTQGGSTITQQLARNLYPDQVGRAQTLTRKIKEAITALKIESVYSKREILETYLNTVPFLYNAYGIEMAARTYFDKPADKLDVLESATLIGMLKGTSYYNPVLNPERAVQRRNTVLEQMVKYHKLSPARLESLKKRPLRVDFERQVEQQGPAPHFSAYLRRWLIDWADRNDYNIYADGLVVHTTIDSRLQAMANQAVKRQGDRLQGVANAEWGPRAWAAKKGLVRAFVRATSEYKVAVDSGMTDEQAIKELQSDADFMRELRQKTTRVQASFVAMDPRDGHIKAWVGSRDFTQDPFDHVQQARRQPGSTFKPFVYGAAFEQGAHPTDTFVDKDVAIPLGGGAFWRPTDAGGPTGRTLTLRDGLVHSINTITAQVMQMVGPAKVAQLAKAMGVRQSKLEQVPSLALGTSPVTLKEMVSAYNTIADDGAYIEPIMVTSIEDRRGNVLEAFHHKAPEQALPVAADQALLDVMRGVIDRGTGAAIRSTYGIWADVAGKTGTTQDNTDGWFILMQPQLVAGAWVGFNDNRVTLNNYWGQGAHSALPIVGSFFQKALNTRVIDARARFDAPRAFTQPSAPAPDEPASAALAATEENPAAVATQPAADGGSSDQPAPLIPLVPFTISPNAATGSGAAQTGSAPGDPASSGGR